MEINADAEIKEIEQATLLNGITGKDLYLPHLMKMTSETLQISSQDTATHNPSAPL